MGVFPYSPEDGTPAEAMSGQVPEKTKIDRIDRLMNLQREIAFEKNNLLIGHSRRVIIDAITTGGVGVGRTNGDCPEIDQEVFVTGPGLKVGWLGDVLIEETEGYDLKGRVVRAF